MDIQSLTLADVAKIEELSKQSISSLADDSAPKGYALAAMAFVVKRKQLRDQDMPTAQWKWEDALALTVDEAYAILGISDGAPTEVTEDDDSVPLDSVDA